MANVGMDGHVMLVVCVHVGEFSKKVQTWHAEPQTDRERGALLIWRARKRR